MRLDKFLSETGTASRSESRKAARAGGISVNGDPVSDPSFPIDPEHDEVLISDAAFIIKNMSIS